MDLAHAPIDWLSGDPALSRAANLAAAALIPSMPRPAWAWRAIPALLRFAISDDLSSEIRDLAKCLDIPWRKLLLANLALDIGSGRSNCAAVAISTPAGPVLARNLDHWPAALLREASTVIEYEKDGRPAFASIGCPGFTSVTTAMSGEGFAIATIPVPVVGHIDPLGFPVGLLVRDVLASAPSFAVALDVLSSTRLFAPARILLVGRNNVQRVVIERTTHSFAHRWPDGDDPLLAGDGCQVLPGAQPERVPYALRADETRASTLAAACVTCGHADAGLLAMLRSVMRDCTVHHAVIRPADGVVSAWVPKVARPVKRLARTEHHRNSNANKPAAPVPQSAAR